MTFVIVIKVVRTAKMEFEGESYDFSKLKRSSNKNI